MGGFAEFLAKELGHPDEKKEELSISKEGMDRFAIYKIGPVLSVSVSGFSLVVLDNKTNSSFSNICYFKLLYMKNRWKFYGVFVTVAS